MKRIFAFVTRVSCGILLVTMVVSLATAKPQETVAPKDNRVTADPDVTEITELMSKQVRAWNAADIPEFMKYYWKSDKLTFSSGGTTRRGWKATLESYQKKYPTPEKMGQLRFSNLEIDVLGEGVALVLGEWQLKRADDPDIGGNFSLVFRKLEGHWLIIHDHSSARDNLP